MIRTCALVLLTVSLVIYTLSRIDADKRVALYETWQEVLMYEIDSARPLEVRVPGDATRLVLGMVALTAPEATYDPKKTYPFEVDVTIEPAGGMPKQLRLWLAPRMSLSEFPPLPSTSRGARVMDNRVWATDAVERLIELPSILRGSAATVTIRPVRGPYSTVLVRVFAERGNMLALGSTRARRLSSDERRTLGALGTGLGFLDMPQAALEQAVATFRVRLDSTGKRGRDYTLRRVLLSNYRASSAMSAARPSFEVAEDRWVAINLQRDAVFDVYGPKLAKVLYGTGYPWIPDKDLTLGEDGHGKLEVITTRPTTLVVGTARAVALSLQGDASIYSALASDRGNLVRYAGVLLVEPDLRRTTWTRLHAQEPVCYGVEGEAKTMRLSARGIGPGHEGLVDVRVRVEPGEPARVWQAPLVMSAFERFVSGELATDAVTRMVRLGKNAKRVCVRGPDNIAVRASARDESVQEPVYEEPYQTIAAQGFALYYAPQRERPWALLAPLARDGESLAGPRSIELLAQVRLTPVEVMQAEQALLLASKAGRTRNKKSGPGRDMRTQRAQPLRGARVLTPTSLIHAQRVFVAVDRRAAGARSDAWVEFTRARTIVVPTEGQVSIAVRAPAARLPVKVEIIVDGLVHTSLDLKVPAQAASLSLSEGSHRLSILAPDGVRAFTRSRAADYQPVWLERQGFELMPQQALRFEFDAKRYEPLAISLQVFSEKTSTPYRLHATLKGMLPQTFVGTTNDHPRAHFWDRDFEARGGVLQASFDLPKAREDARRTLEVVSNGSERLFVRVVLLGQEPQERASSLRVVRRKDQ